MNRRDVLRTTIFGSIAIAAPLPAPALNRPAGYDASKELAAADWKPVFLDAHQNETLAAISDLLIPSTETPGAKEALVNRFLDLLMSAETPETQREFITALAYIDGASMERHQAAFLYLSREQQNDLLLLLAYPHTQQTWGESLAEFPGSKHFDNLKKWIVGAYYSSPAGLKEIGWDGTFPHGVFPGCEHGEGDHANSQ